MKHLQELTIELTDRCPMECRHCSSRSNSTCRAFLSREVVQRLLTEAAKLRTRQISFGGGEPIIAPLFMETLQDTVRKGMNAEVFTCGVMLATNQTVAPIPQDMVRAIAAFGEKVTIVFSFHGASDRIHDTMTCVPGSFGCLLESVERSLSAGIRCTANFVPVKLNVANLQDTIQLLASLGISKLSILRFVPQGRGALNRQQLELNSNEEDRFIDELQCLRETIAIDLRTGSPFNGIIPDNNVPCRAGISKLVVQADGNVLPCEVFKHDGRRKWGTSAYNMDLIGILNSPQFKTLKNILLEGRCAICPVHSILRANQPHSGVVYGISKAAV